MFLVLNSVGESVTTGISPFTPGERWGFSLAGHPSERSLSGPVLSNQEELGDEKTGFLLVVPSSTRSWSFFGEKATFSRLGVPITPPTTADHRRNDRRTFHTVVLEG